MRQEFIQAIEKHQSAFNLDLQQDVMERLADYYELVEEHNGLLHLVGPCSAEEFAVRHILESLTLLDNLPLNARFADVGTGAGLPSMPCLLVRDDLRAVLVESKEKKTRFLQQTLGELGMTHRAEVVNRQFEETDPTDCAFVTCRALDKFTAKIPRLLKWSGNLTCLFFGGTSLRVTLENCGIMFDEHLLPLSDQRYLFLIPERNISL